MKLEHLTAASKKRTLPFFIAVVRAWRVVLGRHHAGQHGCARVLLSTACCNVHQGFSTTDQADDSHTTHSSSSTSKTAFVQLGRITSDIIMHTRTLACPTCETHTVHQGTCSSCCSTSCCYSEQSRSSGRSVGSAAGICCHGWQLLPQRAPSCEGERHLQISWTIP